MVGASVIPMTAGDTVLPDHTVLVKGGRIAAIGPSSSMNLPAGIQHIDARGQYLIPGLTDAHVHLEYFDDPALLGLFLVNGVTTVRNMDGRPYLLDWRSRIANGELLGPTIHTAGPILDGDPPIRDDNTVVRNAAEARAAVAAQAAAGYDFIKVYSGLSADAYRAVVEGAREAGKIVAGHVPRRLTVGDVASAGQHSLEHVTDFDDLVEADSSSVRGRFHWSRLYLAIPVDPEKVSSAARLVAQSEMWVVPTLVQADRGIGDSAVVSTWLAAPEGAFVPADVRELWSRQLARTAARLDAADWQIVGRGRANRLAMLAALRSAGAKIALGTDTPNAFVVPGFAVHQELANFVNAGFSPHQALAAATREAALLIGGPSPAGTLEVGKRADLVLLASNPMADVSTAQSPVGVMVRGVWLDNDRLAEMRADLSNRPWMPSRTREPPR